MAATKASTTKSGGAKSSANVWTDEERAAMQESARERKTASKRDPAAERAEGEADVQAKIAEMPTGGARHGQADPQDRRRRPRPSWFRGRTTGCRHTPRTARSSASSRAKSKFKVRYSTLGFQPDARIDDGEMWPVAFAVTELTPPSEARITELVKKAVG